MLCAHLYGRPEGATIDGHWHGAPVHATYPRTDACQITAGTTSPLS
jgi:hypothetical protein